MGDCAGASTGAWAGALASAMGGGSDSVCFEPQATGLMARKIAAMMVILCMTVSGIFDRPEGNVDTHLPRFPSVNRLLVRMCGNGTGVHGGTPRFGLA